MSLDVGLSEGDDDGQQDYARDRDTEKCRLKKSPERGRDKKRASEKSKRAVSGRERAITREKDGCERDGKDGRASAARSKHLAVVVLARVRHDVQCRQRSLPILLSLDYRMAQRR